MGLEAGDLFLCVVIENSLFVSFVAKQFGDYQLEVIASCDNPVLPCDKSRSTNRYVCYIECPL